tara:strand:- start:46 stop:528 length:483 start_codon:yes stop_codon:yes gene_type:complete
MKLIMESWRGFVNEDNSVIKATNAPRLKSDLKSIFKKSGFKKKIEGTVKEHSLPKTADEYIDEWIEIRLKDWDGNKTTMDAVRKTPLGKNDEFIKWFGGIIDKNKYAKKATGNDPFEVAIDMISDGKTEAEVEEVLTKPPHSMPYSEVSLLLRAIKDGIK